MFVLILLKVKVVERIGHLKQHACCRKKTYMIKESVQHFVLFVCNLNMVTKKLILFKIPKNIICGIF